MITTSNLVVYQDIHFHFMLITLALVLGFVSHPFVVSAHFGTDRTSMYAWLDHVAKTSSPPGNQPRAYNTPELDSIEPGLRRSSNNQVDVGSVSSILSTAKTIVVAKDGSGRFRTVQAAVNSIPSSNSKRIYIHIKAGVYKEKVTVNTSWITFLGDGPRSTEIQWGDTATKAGSTFASASVAVNGDYFTARDISFRNTAPPPPGGAVGRQAVALRISGDFAAFIDVNFYGAQDTLYDHKGRHYFYRCYIEGSIDFIFGNGRSFYFESHLHSIANPTGSLTAQRRSNTTEATGFSFMMCAVTGSGSIYLGRAWGPASRVVFAYTFLDDAIMPKGWFDWADPARRKTVFYGEYKCFGRGSDRGGRVPWSLELTYKQVKPFLTTSFINGELWLSNI